MVVKNNTYFFIPHTIFHNNSALADVVFRKNNEKDL